MWCFGPMVTEQLPQREVLQHVKLGLAMESKHYGRFLNTLSQSEKAKVTAMIETMPRSKRELMSYFNGNTVIKLHQEKYESFVENVLKGSLGPSAQYRYREN